MHILHICSDYSRQRIYNNLVTHLSELNVEQTVFVPVRSREEIGKYENKNLKNVSYHYQHILKPYHRILFKYKIIFIYNKLIKIIDTSKINITHAHFLFSDGAVALKLKKKIGIPYIVAVRNTDLNVFYKHMPHLRSLALEILKEAKSIVFITPSYAPFLLNKYIPEKYHNFLNSKISIIPNGIGDFWLNNIPETSKEYNSEFKLLYVGDFTSNKNVPTIMKSVKNLHSNGIKCSLTLVGGGGRDENKIFTMLKSGEFDMISHEGYIQDRKMLLNIYRTHDIFIMISFKETFGVVYLEAMSQGLPLIYTKNQGIDGYFKEGQIGYSVDPSDQKEVELKIELSKEYLKELSENNKRQVVFFNWKKISQNYLTLYNN